MSLADTPLSVSLATLHIKDTLEKRFSKIAIFGEVTNLKQQASGHTYFSLSDPQAQIQVALFRGAASKLPFSLKNGDEVTVVGAINVYPPRGSYQLVATHVEKRGIGLLLQQLEMLKQKLKAEGLFDENRKKKLPRYPKVIGVVTSPTGAVIQDIIHILTRRFPAFHLLLYPVKVQGEGSTKEIAGAIAQANRERRADVLIVGRGGGSLEDLFCFNDEVVVRALAASEIPTISAVGHETDTTLSDFAADLRAPTPSAAAEIVTSGYVDSYQFLTLARKKIYNRVASLLENCRLRIHKTRAHPLFSNPLFLLKNRFIACDYLKETLESLIKNIFTQQKQKISALKIFTANTHPRKKLKDQRDLIKKIDVSLAFSINLVLKRKKEQFTYLEKQLYTLSYKATLKRGFTVARSGKQILTSLKEAKKKETLSIEFADGEILLNNPHPKG